MENPIANLRREYDLRGLSEADLAPTPCDQFRRWFDEALAARIYEPNAMTLATAAADGRPSARALLLKGFDQEGFVFFTNYESRKGAELAANPWAALLFLWSELHRQVRIEGSIEQVSAAESDSYFQSRPLGSRLGAWASRQSAVIPSRELLEQRMQELMLEYEGRELPRPPHWGGYRLRPDAVEFWQGRPNRLHDRLRYRLTPEGAWVVERLSP
jgi:pyridoxamine 5'-phosphate oxidase